MNTDGCLAGLFTDEIQVYYSTPFSCDSSVQAWLGAAVSLCIFRVIILIMVWGAWFQQRERMKKLVRESRPGDAKARRRSTRLPLIPLISSMGTALLCLFVALASYNIINAQSGTGLVLIILWLLPVCLIQFSTLKKMVSLGFRIFRFKLANAKNDSSIGNIATFDKVLNSLSALMALLLLLSLSSAIVATTEAGRGNVLTRLALVAMGLEQTALYAAMMYQYDRCIRCVVNTAIATGPEPKANPAFKAAVNKMRYQQFVMFITGAATWALLAYYTITLQFYWYIVCMSFLTECFIYFSMALSFLQCGRRQPKNKGETDQLTGTRSGGGESDSASQHRSMAKKRSGKQIATVSVAGDTVVASVSEQ